MDHDGPSYEDTVLAIAGAGEKPPAEWFGRERLRLDAVVKVRLTAEQRARCEQAAGREPLSSWLRRVIAAELERPAAVDVQPAGSSALAELLERYG